MRRLLTLFFLTAVICAPAWVRAGDEEDAQSALDDVSNKILALMDAKSPNALNAANAKAEIATLVPVFTHADDELAKVTVTAASQLKDLGAAVIAKAGVVAGASVDPKTDLNPFLDACRAFQGALDQWGALLPDVRKSLQAKIDQRLGKAPAAAGVSGTAAAAGYVPEGAPTAGGWVSAVPVSGGATGPDGDPPQPATKAPVAVAIGHKDTKLWVANVRDSTVGVMDVATQRFTAQLNVGTQPESIGVDDSDENVVVANYGSSNITLIDGSTDTVTKIISVGAGPMQVVVGHGIKAYVLCQDARTVAVVDLKLHLVLHSIALSSRPARMDLSPDGKQVLVTLPDEDSIAVIDTSYDTVMATVRQQ
jgi:YVTN family beta-propeller protein